MNFDIIIVGAGPAGLCMAQALSGHGLKIALLEQGSLQAILHPAFDGREIGLSQRSVQMLLRLGVWGLIDPKSRAFLRDARVIKGPATFAMFKEHQDGHTAELGWYVSNHLLRQAIAKAVGRSIAANGDIALLTSRKIKSIRNSGQHISLGVENGMLDKPVLEQLQTRLLIAADGRFSSIRTAMGITADVYDFHQTMLVCEMTHAKPLHNVALQWFKRQQQLLLLPMNNAPGSGLPRSSVALTLPAKNAATLLQLPKDDFSKEVSARFESLVGAMQLASTRHAYPLIGVYPAQLVAERFACIGDAAVGMHPITAYGFNFGLMSIETLSSAILDDQKNGQNIASPALLGRYQSQHQTSTKLLYQSSLAMAKFF